MAVEKLVDKELPPAREKVPRRREKKAATGKSLAAGRSSALPSEGVAGMVPPAPGHEGATARKARPGGVEYLPRRPAAPERKARSRLVPELHLELFGVAILAFALLLLLCLISYDPADVSARGGATITGETANLIGPVGAHLADLLLHLLGGGSFLVSLSLGLLGGALFFNRRIVLGLAQVGGFTLFVFCTTILVHLHLRGQRLLGHLPGGQLGELVGEVARSMLGSVGSSVLCWALALISLMLATRLSLSR
ncbi:MAG: hypothetical protein FJ125_14800, partial [Deltaproteobacteria bacterium]|nr:hypothetical protein [Deltaproteobacteria bacterium]